MAANIAASDGLAPHLPDLVHGQVLNCGPNHARCRPHRHEMLRLRPAAEARPRPRGLHTVASVLFK